MPATETSHQIEYLPVGALSRYERNSRTHSHEQVAQIVASIQEFGFTNPVLIDDAGGIIAGHGRVLAATQLGMETVPCIRLSHLSDGQKRAYVIADNQLALNAGWDTEQLAKELSELHAEEFDLNLTGFNPDELSTLLGIDFTDLPADVIEDDVPDPSADPLTKPGDLWLLGDHRLLCGDSTHPDDWDRLMCGDQAALCVTDPPYNIDYGNIKHPKFKVREIANDNLTKAGYAEFCELFVEQIKRTTAGCVYVFGAPGPDGRTLFNVLDRHLHCSTVIIWNKDAFTLGRGKYHNKYEPCWFGWVENGSSFCHDRTLANVWDIPRPRASEEHPTMKPVDVIANPIRHASQTGEIVLDPFLGSGTTLIAAEQLNRRCYGMEISPAYCDVIVSRWETLTGGKAELET